MADLLRYSVSECFEKENAVEMNLVEIRVNLYDKIKYNS